jgi:hemolysin activation/secretion protein
MWFIIRRFCRFLLGGACLAMLPVMAAKAAPLSLPDASKPTSRPQGERFRTPLQKPIPKVMSVPQEEPPKVEKKTEETRLYVKAIKVEGVAEHDDYGITPEAIDALVQDRLAKLGRAQAPAGQAAPEGGRQGAYLGLGELQEIAAAVARFYRQHGFILAQAYIPPQTLKDNTVVMRVMEGRLGEVLVENPRRYTPAQLAQPFAGKLGKAVVQEDMEQSLLLLSDYPGLKVFGVFQPGKTVGEADLVLSVLEEDRSDYVAHFDNYGTEFTGEYRGRLDMRFNDPFKKQDLLSASLSTSYSPHNGLYGAVNYERIAFGPKNRFGIGYSRNAYELGSYLEPLGIKGVTQLLDTYWRRSFHRGLRWNSGGQLQLARKSAKLYVPIENGEDRQDDLTTLAASVNFDWRGALGRSFHAASLTYTHGFDGLLGAMETTSDPNQTTASRRGGSEVYAGGEFSKVEMTYRYWRRLSPVHSLMLGFRGQTTQDLLTSLEQIPMGGPDGVRAYGPSEALRDKAYLVSLEWQMNAPGFAQWPAFGNHRWGEILQFVVFADAAKGWLNDPLASDQEEISLYGVGAGVRLNVDKFSARFEFASPVGKEVAANGRDPQYFFEMNLGF